METTVTIAEFAEKIGFREASVLLNKPEQTLRTRARSKDRDRWIVVNISGKQMRCAKIDY